MNSMAVNLLSCAGPGHSAAVGGANIGIDDERYSSDDPWDYPAIVVSGFQFDKDGVRAAEDVETRVTVHFQKRKNGGGEVIEAQLLDDSAMRVAFEDGKVALQVLQRHHKMRTGEHLSVLPEVFSVADQVRLSPLVQKSVPVEELERMSKECSLKLVNTSDVCGTWYSLRKFEDRIRSMTVPAAEDVIPQPKSSVVKSVKMDERIRESRGMLPAECSSFQDHDRPLASPVVHQDGSNAVAVLDVKRNIGGLVMRSKEELIVHLSEGLNCSVQLENGKIVVRSAKSKACSAAASVLQILCEGIGEDEGVPNIVNAEHCVASVDRELFNTEKDSLAPNSLEHREAPMVRHIAHDISGEAAESLMRDKEYLLLQLQQKLGCHISLEDRKLVVSAGEPATLRKAVEEVQSAFHDFSRSRLANSDTRAAHAGSSSTSLYSHQTSDGISLPLEGGHKKELVREVLHDIPDDVAEQVMRVKELAFHQMRRELGCQICLEDGHLVITAADSDTLRQAVEEVQSSCHDVCHSSVLCKEQSFLLHVDHTQLIRARREKTAELKEIEKRFRCYFDFSRGRDVYLIGASQTNLQAAADAIKQICGQKSKEKHSLMHPKKMLHRDEVEVLPQLIQYLRQKEKEVINGILTRYNCGMKAENGDRKMIFQGEDEESLHRCVEEFITYYQTKLGQMVHTSLQVSDGITRHVAVEVLEQVSKEVLGCVSNVNDTGNEIRLYGMEASVRLVSQRLEEEFDRKSEEQHICSWRQHRSSNTGATVQGNTSFTSQRGHAGCVRSTTIGHIMLEIVEGNIIDERVDAIVNAANEHLSNGAGVALAIAKAGGADVQRECDRLVRSKGPLAVGEAVITKAGLLPCRYVIHTVGPMWGCMRNSRALDLLQKACSSTLALVCSRHLKSVSFPAVSSGIFGMPKRLCANTMLKAIHEFCLSNTNAILCKVRVVLFDQPSIEAFCLSFDELIGPSQGEPSSGRAGMYPDPPVRGKHSQQHSSRSNSYPYSSQTTWQDGLSSSPPAVTHPLSSENKRGSRDGGEREAVKTHSTGSSPTYATITASSGTAPRGTENKRNSLYPSLTGGNK